MCATGNHHCIKKDSCETHLLRRARGIVRLGFFKSRACSSSISATKGVTFMSFDHSLRSLFALLFVVCLSVSSNVKAGLGQSSTATLTGLVQDPTGAVLP